MHATSMQGGRAQVNQTVWPSVQDVVSAAAAAPGAKEQDNARAQGTIEDAVVSEHIAAKESVDTLSLQATMR
jgi:hypothetical protein